MNTENLKHGLKLLYRKREATTTMEARQHFNNEVIGYNKAMEAMFGLTEAGRIADEAWTEWMQEA